MDFETRQDRREQKRLKRQGAMRIHGKRYVTVVMQVIERKAKEASRAR